MFIKFHTLRYKNLLSTGNTFTEIELDKHSTTIMVGRNGAGKSSSWEALVFGLYGKPYRKINKPNLVNSTNKKNLLVEVEFSVGSSRYMIRRGIKPNIFEIHKNGKMLEITAASKDQQEYLEEQILGLNHKSFCQIVIQGSANSTPFMQLTGPNRREVVEDLLDLQIFSEMNVVLKEKISENKKLISEAEHQLDIINEKLEMERKHSTELQENVKEQIDVIDSEIDDNKKVIEKNNNRIEEQLYSVKELSESIRDSSKIDKKKRQYEELKSEFKIKIQRINKEVQFFENNDDCPTCKQHIDQDFKTKIVEENETIQKELSSSLTKLEEKLSEIENREQEIEKVNSMISSLNIDIHSLQTTNKHLYDHNDKLQKDRKQLELKLEQYSFGNNIKQLQNEKNKQEKVLSEYKDQKEVYNITATLLKDTGIKSRILKQYIPVINKLINKYLSIMEFYVNFELDENFNEYIRSLNREDYSYMNFSEGEKQRINLAILFAWRAIARMKNSAATNLLVLDETMDSSLDGDGTEHLMRIITNLDEKANIFVVSHKNDQIIDKFQHVIEFEKINNFTRMK